MTDILIDLFIFRQKTLLIIRYFSFLSSLYRKDCFRNDVFGNCVDALKLSHEKKKLLGFVDEIFGR